MLQWFQTLGECFRMPLSMCSQLTDPSRPESNFTPFSLPLLTFTQQQCIIFLFLVYHRTSPLLVLCNCYFSPCLNYYTYHNTYVCVCVCVCIFIFLSPLCFSYLCPKLFTLQHHSQIITTANLYLNFPGIRT
jgi:hypothetical protein